MIEKETNLLIHNSKAMAFGPLFFVHAMVCFKCLVVNALLAFIAL